MPPVFPFLVGSGRSGTTLFQAIFDQHPDLATVHESHFVAPLAKRRRAYAQAGRFDTGRFVDDLYRNPNFRRLGLPRPEVEARLQQAGPSDYPSAVRAVFALFAEKKGKVRYADKTPGYVVHIPLLADLFPEARFLHIIRDGRDVALAYMDTKWGPADIAGAAMYWRSRVGRGRRAGRKLGPARYREVRYEDLLDDPEPVVKELCPFLDIDFRPEMLTYFERADEIAADTPDPSVHASLALPPTKGLRDWRSQMSAPDVEIFEALAGGLLSALGYERRHTALPVVTRLRAAGAFARWQALRARAATGRAAKRLRRRSPPTQPT